MIPRMIGISDSTLNTEGAVDFLYGSEGGAVNVFLGTTRRFTGDRETVELFYEAADSLAIKEMERIADIVEERWSVLRFVMIHRTGLVPVGEASVLIGAATAHREASFDACRYAIDSLKQTVPIWKKEYFADGETEWVRGTVPGDSDRAE